MTSLRNWVERTHFCAVTVDSCIYVIGGLEENSKCYESLSECRRFDTEENEWQIIAPLNEAGRNPFGVCKNEKIFIAGGFKFNVYKRSLKTCEVCNILTDEWQFIASLTRARIMGSMVLFDESILVLGGVTSDWALLAGKHCDEIECYNPESDEWTDKASVPVTKISIKKREKLPYELRCCTLRVFKQVLTNLGPVSRKTR